MKVLILLIGLSIISTIFVLGYQEQLAPDFISATFCEQAGKDLKNEISFHPDELRDCNWMIQPADSGYSIVSFKLTIIHNDQIKNLSEFALSGNTIPIELRTQILTDAKRVFLEFIKAKKTNGEIVPVHPISIALLQ